MQPWDTLRCRGSNLQFLMVSPSPMEKLKKIEGEVFFFFKIELMR